MSDVTHEPVKKAMGSIRQLSADEEAQRLAESRERGLLNWNWSIHAAREEGARNVLYRQLTRRFGELPAWVAERLDAASAVELEAWADEILEAGSLGELFGRSE